MRNPKLSKKLAAVPSLILVFFLAFFSNGVFSQNTLSVDENIIYQVEDLTDSQTLFQPIASPYLPHSGSAYVNNTHSVVSLTLAVEQSGHFKLYSWWPKSNNKEKTTANYTFIDDLGKKQTITFDQSSLFGQWVELGDVYITSGWLEIDVVADSGTVSILDAFRLTKVGDEIPTLTAATDTLPIAELNLPYSANIKVFGTHGDLSYQMVEPLPKGLSIGAHTGIISGIPQESGLFTIEISISDSSGQTIAKTLELLVTQNTVNDIQQTNLDTSAAKKSLQPRSVYEQSNNVSATSSISLLDELVSMSEGTWKKVNLNQFSEVWPESALRPLDKKSNPTPEKIILAWSSFAWDSNRSNLILYGGGHANYSGNDVYIWNGSTRLWQRASLASEITQDDLGNYRAVDGVYAAPSSAHTYDNNLFLPNADRFMTYGGAAYNNGGTYLRQDGNDSFRTGPYLFNQNLADPNKVGGTTGSHVMRVQPFPEIVGGNMWINRDMYQTVTPTGSFPAGFVDGVTAVTEENGADVIYLSAPSGGTAHQLYKHTITDINDPSQDSFEQVGRYWNGFNGQGAGAFSPSHNLFVRTAGNGFVYWDLNFASPSNRDQPFTPVDLSGSFTMSRHYGMDYFPATDRFLLWKGDEFVWELLPPETSESSWTIDQQSVFSSETPNGYAGSGILGKWKFASDLNAFIGLQDIREGNVWLYKPVGWELPAPANEPPAVNLTQPVNNSTFTLGDIVTLSAVASDTDGIIERIDFYANNVYVDSGNGAAITGAWTANTEGLVQITAIAYDDDNASATSQIITIDVIDNNIAPTVTLTSPLQNSSISLRDSITLSANATDPDGSISKVEFFANGNPIGEAGSLPYQITFIPQEEGTIIFTANAFDNDNKSSQSSPVTVSVVDTNIAPVVSLTSPPNGSEFELGSSLPLAALASDSDGALISVKFYQNGVLLGEIFNPPYTLEWTPESAGIYSVTADATDSEGAVAASDPVQFTVIDTNIAPTISLLSPLEGDSVVAGDLVSIEATVSDTDGEVQKVDFYANNELIGTSSNSPFTIQWPATSAGIASLTATAIDDDGAESTSEPVNIAITNPDGSTTISVVLQKGLNGFQNVQDNYLSRWHKTLNFGSSASLRDQQGTYQPMIRFAIFESEGGPLPDSATIESASLKLYKSSYYDHYYSLHPILRPWNEDQANWNQAADGNNWAMPGGQQPGLDISIAAVAQTIATWQPGWVEFDITSALEVLQNEGNNFGWSLVSIGGNRNSKQYYSSDYEGDPELRPKLEISYQVGGNPAPQVSINAPVDGDSIVIGETILIQASASDANGSVERVEFYSNGNLAGTDDTAPYEQILDSSISGSFEIIAIAYDNENAATSSSPVTISVTDNNVAPEVAITTPNDGSSVPLGEILMVAVTANDSDGSVTRVDMLVNGTKIAEAIADPFEFEYLPTVTGPLTVVVIAFDDDGASTSSAVNISVIDTNIPPEVTIVSPLDGATLVVGDSITLEANASDADGLIQQVEFYRNGELIGQASSTPYQLLWSADSAGQNSFTSKAYDDNGTTTTSAPITLYVTDTNGNSTALLQEGLNGYDGTQDTYLSRWHQNSKFGSRSSLYDRAGTYHQLIQFAIFQSEGGPVPDGAVIEFAALKMYKYSFYNHSYAIHSVLMPWDEDQATWNQASNGENWAQPGGQQPGVDIAITEESQSDTGWKPGWVEFDLTDSIQRFSDGEANNGWSILSIAGNNNLKRYYSSENSADESLRPQLEIHYTQ